jgi:hypothetical protein
VDVHKQAIAVEMALPDGDKANSRSGNPSQYIGDGARIGRQLKAPDARGEPKRAAAVTYNAT